jgi:hypothetical protein
MTTRDVPFLNKVCYGRFDLDDDQKYDLSIAMVTGPIDFERLDRLFFCRTMMSGGKRLIENASLCRHTECG